MELLLLAAVREILRWGAGGRGGVGQGSWHLGPWKKARWRAVATLDGGLVLVLLGWPPGCWSQVTGDHVAGCWGTEDFNTMAMNRGVDFLKNKVPHQCPSRPGGDWGGRGWRPQGSGHLRRSC